MNPTLQFDMAIYVANQLPPKYRLPKFKLLFIACLYALQWRFENWKQYQDGAIYTTYNPAHAYVSGDRCQYLFGTYESLIDGNTGNNPGTSPLEWIKVNDSFIGMNERIMYNGKIITLTWALNREFQTQWRDLPWPAPYDFGTGSGTFPDIYITTTAPAFTSFIAGTDNTNSSAAATSSSSGYATILPIYANAATFLFFVHIPAAVYNSVGVTNAIRDSIFNNFIAQYMPPGISWQLQTY